jgi:hypothetical protein
MAAGEQTHRPAPRVVDSQHTGVALDLVAFFFDALLDSFHSPALTPRHA